MREEAAYIARFGKRIAVMLESDEWIPRQDVYYSSNGRISKLRKVDARAVAYSLVLPAERTRLTGMSQYSDAPSDRDIIASMPERANAYCLGDKLEPAWHGNGFHLRTIQYFRIPKPELEKELQIAKGKKKRKK